RGRAKAAPDEDIAKIYHDGRTLAPLRYNRRRFTICFQRVSQARRRKDARCTAAHSAYERPLTATRLPEGLTSALFPEGIALDGRGRSADRYATLDAHDARRSAPRIPGPGILRPPGGNAARLHAGRGSR